MYPTAVDLFLAREVNDWPVTSQCGLYFPFNTVGQAGGEERLDELVFLILRLTVAWICVWYGCALMAKFMIGNGLLRKSAYADENRAVAVGQSIAMQIKCIILSSLANITLMRIWWPPLDTGFECHAGSEITGVIFISAEIADLICGTIHGLLGGIDIFHHTMHIWMGLFWRGNCAGQLYGALLLAQETSGVFLNYYLLMRNRLGNHWSVLPSFGMFFISFVVYRLGLNTYGTVHYLLHYRQHMPSRVSEWQAHVVAVCTVSGAILQWYWGGMIVQKAYAQLFGKKQKVGDLDTSTDSKTNGDSSHAKTQ